MAYIVSNEFREQLYSGSSKFKGKLTINNEIISNSLISSISISSPIIDTSSEFFYVGSFISQQLTIKFKNLDGIELHSGDEVSLSISQNVNNEWIEVPIGVYLIDDLAENYHKTCEIKCLDYAIKFKPNIDYSPCFVNNKANIRTILNYICDYFDVELGECPTTNDNVEVGTYDSTVSGKQWISYIAEIKGCNAKMDRNGRLVLKEINQAVATSINAKKGKSFELGEKYKISQVTFFDAIRNFTYGEDTDNVLFIRQDNPFVTDTSVVENIYEVVNNFEIYKLKAQNYGDFTLDAWDIIEYQVGENSYKTINNNTMTYAMTIMGEVNVTIPSKQQEVTTNVVEGNLRTVKAEVNSIDNSVKLVVAEVGDRGDKTTTIAEDINSIEAQLQTVPVITTEVEGTGALRLYNIANTRLIEMKVHPTTRDILGLFASPLLKAQQGLKVLSRGITFDSDYDEKDDYYLIPKNLYFVDDVYDEFVYDGVNEKMYIIHRVGIENDEKYKLDEEYIEELDFFDLILDEGDYTVFMSTYPSAYIYIKAMLKNDYTDTFATEVYVDRSIEISEEGIKSDVSNTYATKNELSNTERTLNANITQAVDDAEASINLSVSETLRDVLNEDNKVTAASIVLAVNNDTSQAKISGDKISLEGQEIDLTSNNIKINSDNFSVDETGVVSCSDISIVGGNIDISVPIMNEPAIILDESNLQCTSKFSGSEIRMINNAIPGTFNYTLITGMEIVLFDNISTPAQKTNITMDEVRSPTITQTSLEESKKNIKLFTQNALDIINNIDIYSYNLKTDKNNSKKHIGFVIGDKYNYRKEITNANNNGADLYSFVSVCCKAIQEQQKEIEQLKEEIKNMKEGR